MGQERAHPVPGWGCGSRPLTVGVTDGAGGDGKTGRTPEDQWGLS